MEKELVIENLVRENAIQARIIESLLLVIAELRKGVDGEAKTNAHDESEK